MKGVRIGAPHDFEPISRAEVRSREVEEQELSAPLCFGWFRWGWLPLCCPPGTPYDYLYAEVRSTSGALLSTLATYTNANATTPGNYSQKSFSLASWRGQTVRVQFRATTDFSLPTSFRIDDVSLR